MTSNHQTLTQVLAARVFISALILLVAAMLGMVVGSVTTGGEGAEASTPTVECVTTCVVTSFTGGGGNAPTDRD